jgi:predicted NAD-dependent protein-ADP-ribosyltransferase YbiA (DUF1768 family)
MPTSLNDTKTTRKNVIIVFWKQTQAYQAFSSLKDFTDNVPGYSAETIRNHISRKKKPFETEDIILLKVPFYPH